MLIPWAPFVSCLRFRPFKRSACAVCQTCYYMANCFFGAPWGYEARDFRDEISQQNHYTHIISTYVYYITMPVCHHVCMYPNQIRWWLVSIVWLRLMSVLWWSSRSLYCGAKTFSKFPLVAFYRSVHAFGRSVYCFDFLVNAIWLLVGGCVRLTVLLSWGILRLRLLPSISPTFYAAAVSTPPSLSLSFFSLFQPRRSCFASMLWLILSVVAFRRVGLGLFQCLLWSWNWLLHWVHLDNDVIIWCRFLKMMLWVRRAESIE